MNQVYLLRRTNRTVLNSFTSLVFCGVLTTLASAAVAPKDNAPGVGQAKCSCSCSGNAKGDPFTNDIYNAPGNNTNNCSQLDNRRCAVIRADGTVRDGTTIGCTPASSTSPGKVLPIPPPQRK